MNVMTTSTKVADILAENHVVVLENETVTPKIEEELTENKTITITRGNSNNESKYITAEEILASYTQIVEKVVTEEVEIPYETVTKMFQEEAVQHKIRVVQSGSNGLKRVTYRNKISKWCRNRKNRNFI